MLDSIFPNIPEFSLVIAFAIMAVFFFYVGLAVIIRKKPLLFSQRWYFGLVALFLLPEMFNLLAIFFGWGFSEEILRERESHSSTTKPFDLLLFLFFASILIFAWFSYKGYAAVGVADASLSAAMHDSLRELNIDYTERLSRRASLWDYTERLSRRASLWKELELLEQDATLRVRLVRSGVSSLQLKPTSEKVSLKLIVQGIKRHYKSRENVNYLVAISYMGLGVFMLTGCAFILAI